MFEEEEFLDILTDAYKLDFKSYKMFMAYIVGYIWVGGFNEAVPDTLRRQLNEVKYNG